MDQLKMQAFPQESSTSSRRKVLELMLVVAGFAALTTALTYPLAFHLSTLSYKAHVVGDGQYSIWNVAWVAHALLTDLRHVLDANIFYPHTQTLIYSEANLVAGALGVPVYWMTGGDAYATHNFVVLLSFVLSATGMYYLARHLVGDRRAAIVAAVGFAYCPYVFGRLSHIQLLMTAGIPFSLLAFHRLADRPSAGRGLALGVAMGLQALACAYYGVFVALLVGLAVLVTAGTGRRWKDRRYWVGLTCGAATSIALVLPLLVPYVTLHRETGFGRALAEARAYSATFRTYVRSGARLSSRLEPSLFSTPATPQDQSDVLFPGFIVTLCGAAGLVVAWRARGRQRQIGVLYGAVGAMAFWESFGPRAGLYSLTYRTIPAFTFLRAPSRFGMIVTFALSVLAAVAIAALLQRTPKAAAVLSGLILLFAGAEHASAFSFTAVPPISLAYRVLAMQPAGALLEMPPLSTDKAFMRTQYMLNSTVHWKPLVNAYSDHIPDDFAPGLNALATFPSRAAFEVLPMGVRYATFHLAEYRKNGRLDSLEASLGQFAPFLRRLYADDETWLYEIVGYPR